MLCDISCCSKNVTQMYLWRHRIESRDMLSPAIFIPPTIDKRQLLLYLCIIIIQYRNMKNSTDTRLLRRDLVRAAREILDMRARSGIGPELSLRALAALALAQRPRAHYISFDRASAVVHAWRRGVKPRKHELRCLVEALDKAICDFQSIRPHLSFTSALALVLSVKRPDRFYLSVDSAQDILAPYFRPRLQYVGDATIS